MRILRRISSLSTADLEQLQEEILLEIQRRKEALTVGLAAQSAQHTAEQGPDPKANLPRRRAA